MGFLSRPGTGRRVFAILVAMLLVSPCVLAITISEIHYHPEGGAPEEANLEFVEIYNDSPVPFDLSGCFFSQGINFVFPEETYLKARAAIAVCANVDAVKGRFPEANAVGNFQGRLDNGGERIALVTKSGAPLVEVDYQDRGRWPVIPDGTGYTLSLKAPFADVGTPESWTWSAQPGGTPGRDNFPPPAIANNGLFSETGSTALWSYRKGWNETTMTPEDFSTPPGAWKAPGFDDSTWPQGQTPIGFGETEIVTPLEDMDGKYISFAGRKRFQITPEQLEEMLYLTLSVRVDDGFVGYLNGQEIGRSGLPGAVGADVPFDATASLSRELKATKPFAFKIPRELVHAGENVLAVQVHNRTLTASGSDAGFAATLTYQTDVIFPPAPGKTVVVNEVVSRASPAERGVELLNTLKQTVDVGGFVLSPGPEKTSTYTIPAGTSLEPGGILGIPQAALGFSLAGPEISLFLFEGADGAPADAVTVEDPVLLPATAQSHARSPDGEGRWWISLRPSLGGTNQVDLETGLVINEIHFNPKIVGVDGKPGSSTEHGELVELFNRSSHPIALDGFRFTSGFQYAFGAGTSLAPGAYLVVARNPKYVRDAYGLPPEQVLGPPETATAEELDLFGTLRNSGERIRIVDALGNTVDEVAYAGEGEWDSAPDEGGSSLELIDPNQDNGSPHAWTASDETMGAPWTEISHDASYITTLAPQPMEPEFHIFLLSEGECLLDGISVTQGDPPVEVITNGDFEIDTRPWRIAGNHIQSVRTTDEAKLGAACLRLVATGPGDNRVNRIEVETMPQLKAGPVKIRLWARWLKGSNALHISGHNNVFGKTIWLPIPAATGTPGRENGARARLRAETGSDNLGPVVSGVSHEPAVPGDMESIVFRSTVTDPDGVASVEALNQRDGAVDFTRTPLFDDGQHDDGAAGDGAYAGETPGYPLRTLVNFLIEARDAGGRVRQYPRLAPAQTLLFAVDDKIESTVSKYRLLVNAKNLNTPVTGLARRLLHSDELVRGTFIFEESEVYYDIGLRYRGSPWNRPPDPKMFRVRFNGDRPFLDGVKRINISRYGGVQNEGTAYQLLFKASPGPEAVVAYSPRYSYLTMKLNTAAHGNTALSEIRPIDGDYVRYHWPNDPDGYAWKVSGKLAFTDGGQQAPGSPDWTQLKAYRAGPYPGTDSAENYRFYFNPATRDEEDNFEGITRLCLAMDRATTPDNEYDARIAQILNVEASLRVYAVRALLADWDTIDIGNGQNAYIYYAPLEGRNYLVPWDMDHTFERAGEAIVPTASTVGFRRLINRPLYKRQYARILGELLETSWSQAYVSNWTNLILETGGPARVANGTGLLSFLNGRRGLVTALLRSGTGVPFAITSPDPSGFPAASGPIAGTAGIEVAFLLASVNGGDLEPLEPVWSTPPRQASAIPTLWEAQITGLMPGKNTVQILAADAGANPLASKTIDVYNTTGWEAPAVTEVVPGAGPVTGGTPITVRGTGFRVGARLEVGGKPAANTLLVSESEITGETPPGEAQGTADLVVANIDGQKGTLASGFLYEPRSFRRGEVDGVEGINQTDVLTILFLLFRGEPLACSDAADINDDGLLNITDPIVLIRHLFQGGASPPEPFSTSGQDPTEDELGC